ncbi:MAG: GuaB3 family IMP dehydrogenase-related protein [SAR202 cluster bacterium]|jgi:IMP dehydrogenase|nr:GuaB3 family IMP dehydrogenase-related protein [Chloroflexota bacterium]MDP6420969.1 GuaB3 family IMP dehydrogenase-related protein [SAR202 cluster bacterium]HAL46766.1 GuaB3 family IMP dehydrogenase-related protein [Dehalococcoidia bacterium]MDP6665087.1 GuaB3 family IMP dehydrogenase-related protein [SAR202 cluster bacterium]MDP6799921.1 GuaB3 family IMP dehydrogenase-related protein [SAR202 cluster bacterium]|tara:strand:+ start:606 stop:1751 length:1146 start_codon:yes stop_codon:yes gene_type:complete
MGIPQLKELRRAYGFDEVAIVPGSVTINPEMISTDFSIDGITLSTPVLGAAMDAVASPRFASTVDELGGMAVINIEGVQTRYTDPDEVLAEIVDTSPDQVTALLQKVYSAPIQDDLVGKRVEEIRNNGAKCAVSVTPASTKRLAPIAAEAGADIIVVQSTVTTARHVSHSARGLRFPELLEMVPVPVIVGNCVSYDVALELMETGIHGVLVGVGPGAACTTRDVTGVGVPQVTATLDCSAARNEYMNRSGRYVPIITDGGIRTGGDLCKAFASGADAVMLGTPLAQAEEAPGGGHNWGMANPHPDLPRGTRVNVGVKGSLRQILFGPTSKTDGTQNLIGALRICMGMIGAATIKDMHEVAELIVAPAIKTEGKHYQLGMLN